MLTIHEMVKHHFELMDASDFTRDQQIESITRLIDAFLAGDIPTIRVPETPKNPQDN